MWTEKLGPRIRSWVRPRVGYRRNPQIIVLVFYHFCHWGTIPQTVEHWKAKQECLALLPKAVRGW